MTETERKLLTKALGECWHEIKMVEVESKTDDCEASSASYLEVCIICGEVGPSENRTFASAQDYEDLLEKVVRPNLYDFGHTYLYNKWWDTSDDNDPRPFQPDQLSWFLTLSIEERNKLIHDFCIYMYEQGDKAFEWVKEFVGKEEKQMAKRCCDDIISPLEEKVVALEKRCKELERERDKSRNNVKFLEERIRHYYEVMEKRYNRIEELEAENAELRKRLEESKL